MSRKEKESQGYGFGTFAGVFTPSILTIIGVVMYLRFGWMLGNVGLVTSLVIVTAASSITFLTGLSISSLATNMRVKGGGAYFMLSRSFGLEAGAAIGIPLALSQAVSVSFYVAGFAEALVGSGLPAVGAWDPRLVGLATLVAMAVLATVSADAALKTQFFIMGAIVLSLASFFAGGTPPALAAPDPSKVPAALDFWVVFAVFFPAVTGILSGVGMSGDLKNPSRSIPVGTLAAVLTGWAVYMAVPLALNVFVPDPAILRTDTMILQKCARWPFLILLGVWAATLSSALGGLLCAPRVVQALAQDRLMPRILGRGYGVNKDPRLSSALCFLVAAAGLWFGDINALAPILTMFNLTTYGLLNLSAGLEELMGNPSWRPTFRVRPLLSLAGFAGCFAAMFMISPGWTFCALVFEGFIYWFVKRRAMRARWGDMRTGLLMYAVQVALRLLGKRQLDERNWRPNLLVLASVPLDRPHLLTLAAAVSGGRSFVTLASVVPEAADDVSRETALRDSILRHLNKVRLEAQIRIFPSDDTWSGLRELVRAYGFGPLTPNTVILGTPMRAEDNRPFGGLLHTLARCQRNLILLGEGPANPGDPDGPGDPGHCRIDVWWRGQTSNGAFMLALACLVLRGDAWRGATLRLCNIAEPGMSAEEAERILREFLAQARVAAEVLVLEPAGDRPFNERICEASSDAALTFIGLRGPGADEAPDSYGDYVQSLTAGISSVPLVVFALAGESVDFRRIFRE
ncbi:MAG: Na-K-Cl cotransporter [Kiritimatiellae bacterium]|nr:Na-K-Cl cotransporter [Kiritimatiellia bacterium]